jgi:hypothetical protein
MEEKQEKTKSGAKKQKIEPKIEAQAQNEQEIAVSPAFMDQFQEITSGGGDASSDSFFKATVNQLNSPKNIGMKTEYRDVNENFSGAKLHYLGQFCNMPYLKEFVEVFETKRVSLERKGRIEIIKALQERRQEIELEQRKLMMNGMMGGSQI